MNNYWEPNTPQPTQPKRDWTWLYWLGAFIAIALIAGCEGYYDQQDDIALSKFAAGKWHPRTGCMENAEFKEIRCE